MGHASSSEGEEHSHIRSVGRNTIAHDG